MLRRTRFLFVKLMLGVLSACGGTDMFGTDVLHYNRLGQQTLGHRDAILSIP